ncbi:uncharacterized protein FA14DRAFT_160886 [Meira miltonrushii]|uniref:T-cell immunomodulatory protein TIP C2 domain-containing protein n=1 Tax=Meira miltonrushii TaxID=1280837 RepID=A0A316VEG9_9BASI|nr:uncharacterized protein FA14DRAFT_160886 [Meira miltonrushii]PWN35926.1 hypothetical protein FA14DRAFT_160886 [Meira miltonrushii]
MMKQRYNNDDHQSWKKRRRTNSNLWLLCLAVVILSFIDRTNALFGLPTKRFRYEGLIDAGSLGLEGLNGQVTAFGDWNADSAIDVFTISQDGKSINVYIWDHTAFKFVQSPLARITAPRGNTFVNIVPADFNYDGKLDVLAMMKGDNADQLEMAVWLGTQEGSVAPSPVLLNASTSAQPITLDVTGNMRGDLLGHLPTSSDKLSIWRNALKPDNSTEGFVVEDAPLYNADGASKSTTTCHLANPHSSAFIDLNGDCLADLFLVCSESNWGWGSSSSYQIWTANKDSKKPGYTLARQGKLPDGAGALSFADMDRDGTIDVVFPSCDGKSGPCYINIAYNRQMPLCSEKRDDWFGVGPGGATLTNSTQTCRDTEYNLCTADDSFSFDFSTDPSNDKMARIPLADVVPENKLLLSDDLLSSPIPVPLALGDFNRDGYPDLAIITIPTRARGDETHLRLLESVPCNAKGAQQPGCPSDPKNRHRKRTFKMLDEDVQAIDAMTDARSAVFFDLDEDGSLDLLVQRLPTKGQKKDQRSITFVQNNFFYDAFFLKAMTSNGACSSYCDPSGPGKDRYRPWGVNYGGASYKFTVLDTNGIRRPQQVGQLAQTAYRSLLLPYAYFGLGRTNNYVESLFVGVTRRREVNYVELEGVIPNSQVVILPWEPVAEGEQEMGDSSTWKRELYVSPGEWIPWVTVVLVTIIVMLLGVVFVLHLNEKREDERERKRAVHAINFDAL